MTSSTNPISSMAAEMKTAGGMSTRKIMEMLEANVLDIDRANIPKGDPVFSQQVADKSDLTHLRNKEETASVVNERSEEISASLQRLDTRSTQAELQTFSSEYSLLLPEITERNTQRTQLLSRIMDTVDQNHKLFSRIAQERWSDTKPKKTISPSDAAEIAKIQRDIKEEKTLSEKREKSDQLTLGRISQLRSRMEPVLAEKAPAPQVSPETLRNV